jgi:hypothetical protein
MFVMAVDRADGVEDIVGFEATRPRRDGAACGTAADLATLRHDLGPAHAVNRPIDAAASCQARVRRVHDRVSLHIDDVALCDFEKRAVDCSALHGSLAPSRCRFFTFASMIRQQIQRRELPPRESCAAGLIPM